MEKLKTAKQKIINTIRERCIYIPEEKYMFGKLPGTRYNSQFYMNNALFDPEFMHSVSYSFYEIFELEKKKDSGLLAVSKFLTDINGIKFNELKKSDVVRNPLVKEIINAYEIFEKDSE